MLSRYEWRWERTRLLSLPSILSIEPTNACNLRCPFCFTGAGARGRPRSTVPLDLARRLLAELGDRLILLKTYGWGEPLLCDHLAAMIADAHDRGVFTVVNSNFSVPLTPERARGLVASGLDELVVSIDGAGQETYERYRVGGKLARVLENVRLLKATRDGMGRTTPALVIEFHPFPWNTGDIPEMQRMAIELGAALRVFKGCVPGPEWGRDEPWRFCIEPQRLPCAHLWTSGVIAADGGVQPCHGTFYREDDMGRIDPAALEGSSFRAIWNNERYQLARRFFRAREGSEVERRHVCFDCPAAVAWDRWKRHVRAGGDFGSFVLGYTTNDAWNYFWNRRVKTAPHLERDGQDHEHPRGVDGR